MSSLRADPRAVIAVVAGGCVGGPLRYAAGQLFPDAPASIPWATFGVNVIGAAVLAVLLVFVLEGASSIAYLREFAGVGVLGSFTTFSTWMVQSHNLAEGDHAQLAFAYLGGSLVAGMAAAIAGVVIGRSLINRRRKA